MSPAPEHIVIGTKNPDKRAEMVAVLAAAVPGIEVVDDRDWDDVDETGRTLAENAFLKARAVVEATGLPAVADDTGLEVDALGGRPGVHTARFAGPNATYAENRARMLADLEGVADRSARFRTVVVLAGPGLDDVVVEGVLEGQIAHAERGEFGFGYDSIFEIGDRTLAEISEDVKNRISHRALALQALVAVLTGD